MLTIETAQQLVNESAKWSNFGGSIVLSILDKDAFRVQFQNGRQFTLYASILRERNAK